jgi:hypothetical protein
VNNETVAQKMANPACLCVNGTDSRGESVNFLAYFQLSVSRFLGTIAYLGRVHAASSCSQGLREHLRKKVRTKRRKKFSDQTNCAVTCRPFIFVS